MQAVQTPTPTSCSVGPGSCGRGRQLGVEPAQCACSGNTDEDHAMPSLEGDRKGFLCRDSDTSRPGAE